MVIQKLSSIDDLKNPMDVLIKNNQFFKFSTSLDFFD